VCAVAYWSSEGDRRDLVGASVRVWRVWASILRGGRGVSWWVMEMAFAGVDDQEPRSIYLCDSSTEKRADEVLEALEFGLDNYESEVGFGVCVAGLFFHQLNL